MVMVLTHHSQLNESEFELNLPKPRFSFYKSRDTVECPHMATRTCRVDTVGRDAAKSLQLSSYVGHKVQ